MKGQSTWSYAPFAPLMWDAGDIYICRVAPYETSIHFEWLATDADEYRVFYRVRGEGEYVCAGSTAACEFDIRGLSIDTDYEFFVCAGEKRSRIRLARCGASVGSVVNYLHPNDEVYAFSGRFLCSPSLVRHPDGYLLAAMDVFAPEAPQNLSLIFRSDDDGESWHYVSELHPCFWGKLFVHRGVLYMLSVSTEYGDLLIGKSTDGGKTFSPPVALLRGFSAILSPTSGKFRRVGIHKNPQNLVLHKGRLYETLEWGSWNVKFRHAAMVMSMDENDDPMRPESWHFSEPVKYDPAWEGTAPDGIAGNLEGTLCVAPDGTLYNMMRYQTQSEKKILAYRVNTDDSDAPLEYSHAVEFPANLSKFMIKRDPISGRYYSIACRRIDEPETKRNLLSLLTSEDLEHWELVCDLIDRREEDPEKIGFQYVDFEIEGEDLIYLCRTAINGANSFHDANYSTFHRVKKFRELLNR
ncbi:MAG: hypothetical protein IKA05_09810 [Clostridia bacterium]|nr:hypothetical protein [Clostridia bacterium]